MKEKLLELYKEGKLEFNPQGPNGDYVTIVVFCSQLNPNPIYIEVNKYEYRQTGNDACIEKLASVLDEEDYVKLL